MDEFPEDGMVDVEAQLYLRMNYLINKLAQCRYGFPSLHRAMIQMFEMFGEGACVTSGLNEMSNMDGVLKAIGADYDVYVLFETALFDNLSGDDGTVAVDGDNDWIEIYDPLCLRMYVPNPDPRLGTSEDA